MADFVLKLELYSGAITPLLDIKSNQINVVLWKNAMRSDKKQ